MKYPYIVSIAWKSDDKPTEYFILNQGGRKIPKDVIKIHGITDKMCAESPYCFKDIINKLFIEEVDCEVVIGHGLYFDTSVIKANILREIKSGNLPKDAYKLITELFHKNKRVDTMWKSRKLFGKFPKLINLYKKLFKKGFKAHNAKSDVEACYKSYKKMVKLGIIVNKG